MPRAPATVALLMATAALLVARVHAQTSALERIHPWLYACDLVQPADDLKAGCTMEPTSRSSHCPRQCQQSHHQQQQKQQPYISSSNSHYHHHHQNASSDNLQCLYYLEESHKATVCTGGGGDRLRQLETLRLRHCCEHSIATVLQPRDRHAVLAGGAKCTKFLDALLEVDALAARISCEFNEVLTRYDCGQPYSIVYHCDDCKEAYRRWVCSSLLPLVTIDGGRVRPCRSVCQTVEQRCPYMLPGDRAPAHPTQYAGEPTFLCLDPNIPETGVQRERSSHGESDCCYTYCGTPGRPPCVHCPKGAPNTTWGPMQCSPPATPKPPSGPADCRGGILTAPVQHTITNNGAEKCQQPWCHLTLFILVCSVLLLENVWDLVPTIQNILNHQHTYNNRNCTYVKRRTRSTINNNQLSSKRRCSSLRRLFHWRHPTTFTLNKMSYLTTCLSSNQRLNTTYSSIIYLLKWHLETTYNLNNKISYLTTRKIEYKNTNNRRFYYNQHLHNTNNINYCLHQNLQITINDKLSMNSSKKMIYLFSNHQRFITKNIQIMKLYLKLRLHTLNSMKRIIKMSCKNQQIYTNKIKNYLCQAPHKLTTYNSSRGQNKQHLYTTRIKNCLCHNKQRYYNKKSITKKICLCHKKSKTNLCLKWRFNTPNIKTFVCRRIRLVRASTINYLNYCKVQHNNNNKKTMNNNNNTNNYLLIVVQRSRTCFTWWQNAILLTLTTNLYYYKWTSHFKRFNTNTDRKS